MRFPSLERGMVVILSTIRLQGSRRPLTSSASTRSRNSGASVGSVVNTHTVTDSVASKRSSWTIATGRGFPTWPLPAAAVQISPRLNSIVVQADCVDERLIVLAMSARSDGSRLPVRLALELDERTSGTQIWTGRRP